MISMLPPPDWLMVFLPLSNWLMFSGLHLDWQLEVLSLSHWLMVSVSLLMLNSHRLLLMLCLMREVRYQLLLALLSLLHHSEKNIYIFIL